MGNLNQHIANHLRNISQLINDACNPSWEIWNHNNGDDGTLSPATYKDYLECSEYIIEYCEDITDIFKQYQTDEVINKVSLAIKCVKLNIQKFIDAPSTFNGIFMMQPTHCREMYFRHIHHYAPSLNRLADEVEVFTPAPANSKEVPLTTLEVVTQYEISKTHLLRLKDQGLIQDSGRRGTGKTSPLLWLPSSLSSYGIKPRP